jgi:hypothetical protein
MSRMTTCARSRTRWCPNPTWPLGKWREIRSPRFRTLFYNSHHFLCMSGAIHSSEARLRSG